MLSRRATDVVEGRDKAAPTCAATVQFSYKTTLSVNLNICCLGAWHSHPNLLPYLELDVLIESRSGRFLRVFSIACSSRQRRISS